MPFKVGKELHVGQVRCNFLMALVPSSLSVSLDCGFKAQEEETKSECNLSGVITHIDKRALRTSDKGALYTKEKNEN
jgi:hypothetical protein